LALVKKVMKTVSLKGFVEAYGRRYSEVLGIRLRGGDDGEVFKWFLASLLFGAPITEFAAIKTYGCFERHGVLTAEKILEAGWEGLVGILDEGGYTRYDYKTADKLLMVANNLVEAYGGSVGRVHGLACDSRDLEGRLKGLGKGVGDVTVSIFLRELRGVWEWADPCPTGLELLAGERLGILERRVEPEEALKQLKAFWAKNEVAGKSFVHFETALLRLGKECRRGRCNIILG
jgi:endonuclease III